MTIHKIERDDNFKIRQATITLNCEEVSNIANMLVAAVKLEENSSRPIMHTLNRDFYLLFELVKNGCIDSVTVEYLGKIQEKINKNYLKEHDEKKPEK